MADHERREEIVCPMKTEVVHACEHVVVVRWQWVEPALDCEAGCKEHHRVAVHQMPLS